MSRFDLGKPLDFARLTQGDIGALIQQFAGRDPSQWDLLEGRYNNVLFHVFESKSEYQAELPQITDTGGRRKVKYRFPYKDGQTTDDLGRSPRSFELEILLHGQRYMQGFDALINEFNKPTPGFLLHPVLGSIRVAVENYVVIHSNEKRQAVMMKVTFIEHNFDIGSLNRTFKDTTAKGALTKALETFQKIEAVIANVQGAISFVRSVKNRIVQDLEEYNNNYGLSLVSMNKAFNTGTNSDIPNLLPVNEGGTRNADGSLITDEFPIARSASDPFFNIPIAALSQPVPTVITVNDVYNSLLATRAEVAAIIQDIINSGGSLELYDDILNLRQSAVDLQDVFEKGSASSRTKVVEYITPRLMSLREAAFESGLDVNRVQELDILNPELESVNYIPKGTSLQVPIL